LTSEIQLGEIDQSKVERKGTCGKPANKRENGNEMKEGQVGDERVYGLLDLISLR
jgi:hypothetical protein